jgi:hypothetical protein
MCNFLKQSLFFVTVLNITTTTLAQNKKSSVSGQLQKGKWIIGTNLVELGPSKRITYRYDANDKVTGTEKETGMQVNFLLYGPNWGELGFGNGNNSIYDTNNVQQYSGKSNGFYLRLRPAAGYFITNRFMLGAQFDISFNKSNSSISGNSTGKSENKGSGIGFGPELRYYFGNLETKKIFHVGVAFVAGVSTYSEEGNQTQSNSTQTWYRKDKGSYFRLTPYIGYTKLLGKRWMLEPILYSKISQNTNKSDSKYTSGNSTTMYKDGYKNKFTNYAGLALRMSYTF